MFFRTAKNLRQDERIKPRQVFYLQVPMLQSSLHIVYFVKKRPLSCQIVANLSERRNILKKFGRCYNCMRKGRVSSQCDTPVNCNFCKDNNHAALCLKTFKSVESGATNGTASVISPDCKCNMLFT